MTLYVIDDQTLAAIVSALLAISMFGLVNAAAQCFGRPR
jgi:hypothetical protein